MPHLFRSALLGLSLCFTLSACNTPPPKPAPAPPPVVVKKPKPTGPQPFENGVISVPVSPVQTVPSNW